MKIFKRVLLFILVLILCGAGYLGYVYFIRKPAPEKDLQTAEKILEDANTDFSNFSSQMKQEIQGYEVSKSDGTKISAEDLFIETDNGILVPRESVITELDPNSVADVVVDIAQNSNIDSNEAQEYAKQILKMPSVQKKAAEYALQNGIDIGSLMDN